MVHMFEGFMYHDVETFSSFLVNQGSSASEPTKVNTHFQESFLLSLNTSPTPVLNMPPTPYVGLLR